MTIPQSTLVHTTEQEEWRAISGYEGFYEVSNLGNVRSVLGSNKVPPFGLLRPWLNSTGYPRIGLARPVPARSLVHRLVAAAFLGPCPPDCEVNHKDGNRDNPRADNLEYVTRSGNVHHAIDTGLMPVLRGAQRASKLTEQDVRLIRSSSVSTRKLAKQLGITRAYLMKVRDGGAWAHIEGGRKAGARLHCGDAPGHTRD